MLGSSGFDLGLGLALGVDGPVGSDADHYSADTILVTADSDDITADST
jgi:hypothetical protein